MKKFIRLFVVFLTLTMLFISFAFAATTNGQLINSTISSKNPYLVRTFIDGTGRRIDEVIVPGKPPKIKAPSINIPKSNPASGIKSLSDVPAFDWSYGCSATSAAMMMGYYDNYGFPNMYTGPTNGGVCPMNNSVWGHTTYPHVTCGECPLSATHKGVDGKTTKGHVDDYWIDYGNSGPDPYIGNWTEHTTADCTGDFMGTNQSKYGNEDGSTTFYYYDNGDPLYDYTACEPGRRDGCHGLRLFAESRGYTVDANFTQYIKGQASDPNKGFTFDDYKAEIDAGRPVLIQLEGHTIIGFGYNTTGQIVYIHDAWDYRDHQMTWGGTYSDLHLQQWGVTVLRLHNNNITPPSVPQNLTATAGDSQITLNWQAPSNNGGASITNYKIYRGTSSGNETYLTSTTSTSYTDTGLTNGTTYYYYVTAVNSAGEGPKSNEATATPVSQTHTITITDTVSTIGYYEPVPTFGGAGTVNALTNKYVYRMGDTIHGYLDVTPSTQWRVELRKTNGAVVDTVDIAAGSNSFTTGTINVSLDGEYNVVAVVNGQDYASQKVFIQYNLTWRSNTITQGDATQTISGWVTRGSGQAVLVPVTVSIAYPDDTLAGTCAISPSSSGQFTITFPLNNRIGNFNVYLSDGYDPANSDNDAMIYDTLSNESLIPPSSPQNLTATAGDSQITLNWQAPSNNGGASITNYKIYRGLSSGNETYLTSTPSTSYTDTGLTNGTTYYYKVSAVNSVGEGPFSNEASATPINNTSSRTLSIPDTQSAPGSTVTIPINVNDADDIAGGDFTVTFNSNILTATDVQLTSLTNGFLLTKNLNNPGEVIISLASTSGISDSSHAGGALVNITFTVSASAQSGATTTLTFTKSDIKDENGSNIPSTSQNGTFTVGGMLGDVNGDNSIDSGDAILVLRYSAGLITLTPSQLACADVNKDGAVDSGDAILILRYAAGLINHF